jgi:hypothetical protein
MGKVVSAMNHVHPKAMGFFNRLFSDPLRFFNLSTDLILNGPPTLPSSIFLATSELLAAPVVISPDVVNLIVLFFHLLSFLPLIQLQTPFWFYLYFIALQKLRQSS